MAEKEYIECDKLIRDGWHLQRYVYGNGYACIESMDIRDIPAADVRPVVRGEWEYKGDFTYHCSVCDENIYTPRLSPYNFCPNCGADMRRKSDG